MTKYHVFSATVVVPTTVAPFGVLVVNLGVAPDSTQRFAIQGEPAPVVSKTNLRPSAPPPPAALRTQTEVVYSSCPEVKIT